METNNLTANYYLISFKYLQNQLFSSQKYSYLYPQQTKVKQNE